jgi:hypothetical protein
MLSRAVLAEDVAFGDQLDELAPRERAVIEAVLLGHPARRVVLGDLLEDRAEIDLRARRGRADALGDQADRRRPEVLVDRDALAHDRWRRHLDARRRRGLRDRGTWRRRERGRRDAEGDVDVDVHVHGDLGGGSGRADEGTERHAQVVCARVAIGRIGREALHQDRVELGGALGVRLRRGDEVLGRSPETEHRVERAAETEDIGCDRRLSGAAAELGRDVLEGLFAEHGGTGRAQDRTREAHLVDLDACVRDVDRGRAERAVRAVARVQGREGVADLRDHRARLAEHERITRLALGLHERCQRLARQPLARDEARACIRARSEHRGEVLVRRRRRDADLVSEDLRGLRRREERGGGDAEQHRLLGLLVARSHQRADGIGPRDALDREPCADHPAGCESRLG